MKRIKSQAFCLLSSAKAAVFGLLVEGILLYASGQPVSPLRILAMLSRAFRTGRIVWQDPRAGLY